LGRHDASPDIRSAGVFRALCDQVSGLAGSDPRICVIRLDVDRSNERAQEVYDRLGMHRSNYGVMQTVYRGPESHEE
jgi:ribosomal protein S18 acetylase RimI-like enzyme